MVLLTDQLRMDRSHKMAEQILNLTLEIIYLLTGEDYIVVKKSGERGTTSSDHQPSEGWSEIRSAIMVPPPPSPMHERSNEKKIVEITNKILQVVTGEVPVRCQDITVYLSMEEWEYMEGHKDQYKDFLMEDPWPHATTVKEETDHKHKDGPRNSPSTESCPRPVYCKEGPRDNPNVPPDRQNNDLIIVKVEETEEDEEYYRSDDLKREEETPTNVSADVPPSLGCGPLPSSSDYSANLNISQTIYGQPFITINLPSLLTSGNLLSVPTTVLQPSSDQSQASQLPPKARGAKKPNNRRTEGRFPCAECGKRFAMRSNFLEHLKVHTVEKPLSCTVCGKCFKRKSEVVRHQKTHTGQSGEREKPHLCTECGKRFASKSKLFSHHRIHTGERPFPCPVCGKCFIRKADLVVHEIAHTGEKPFGCTVCGKYYNRKRSLLRHKRVHMRHKS